jgi:hypothetical protein
MNQWLRRNNKKLLAFFGVFLMVAFLLPTTFQGFNRGNPTLGTLGDGSRVYYQEVEQANDEWRYLRTLFAPTGRPPPDDLVPVLAFLSVGIVEGEQDKNELLYYLLRKEAERLGIRPREQTLDGFLEMIRIQTPDGRLTDYESIRNKPQGAYTRQAAANLLAVEFAFRRAAGAIKVTRPEIQTFMAMQFQTLALDVVPFYVSEFEPTVGEISAEQLRKQFDAYADTLPDRPTDENIFGFGYKFPDRVKLQYIRVSREALRAAVMDDPTYGPTPQDREYYWAKEAYKYFLDHQDEFPPPTTQAADGTTLPSATQPATTPEQRFEQVRAVALERVVGPEIDKLARKVQGRITSALNADYIAWSNAKSTNATPPNTLGAYDSLEYLNNLANDVNNRFKVLPQVVNLGDELRSGEELARFENLGQFFSRVPGREMSLPQYVFTATEAFVPADKKDEPSVLSLMEPSQVLDDVDGGFAQFRVTAAEPARRPTSIDEVAEAVRRDVRIALAMDAATAAAQKLIDSAGEGGLSAAAQSAGRKLVDLDEVRFGAPILSTDLPAITPAGVAQFQRVAFDLLAKDPASRPRAVARVAGAETAIDPLAATTRPTTQPAPQPFAAAVELTGTTGVLEPAMMEIAEDAILKDRITAFQRPFAVGGCALGASAVFLCRVKDSQARRRRMSPTAPSSAAAASPGSGTTASLYTIPPLPFGGVLVTIAYSSPKASWPKPCTVNPLGNTPLANWGRRNSLITPVVRSA